jgi:RHS repeat-associated protein
LGNSFLYTYNTLGLPESAIEPATTAHPNAADRTWTVGYDAGAYPAKISAPGGVTREATYDAGGRLVAETGAGASVATSSRKVGYDLLDQITSVSAPGGTNTYTYDDRGNLLTARGPGGSADYAYDSDGNESSRKDAAGQATFTYTNGRLATVADGLSGTVQRYGYDTAGLLSTVDFGSGRVRTFGYDDLARNTSDTLKNSAGAVVSAVNYSYNANDQIVGKSTTGTAGAGNNTYAYDLAGRLTSWTGPTGTTAYEWDAAGNRTRTGDKTATYDQRNRLLSDGDYTYTHTARGTRATRTSSGLTERFDFDAFDRMVGAAGHTYTYDGVGRLVSRDGMAVTYAGLSAEPVADGVEKFARGPEDDLLAVGDATGTTLALADEHGDIVGGFAAGDTALGGLPDSTAYDPFGEVLTAKGDTGNLGYQGDWTDPDTKQVNMGARWYDPNAGAFTARDTVDYTRGDSITANRYTYGNGDPLNFTDPDGQLSCGFCKSVKKKAGQIANWVGNGISSGGSFVKKHVSAGIKWFGGAVWSGAKFVGSKIASGAKWVGKKFTSGAKWVGSKFVSGLKAVGRGISKGAKWLYRGTKTFYKSAKNAYQQSRKAVRDTINWTARKAEQARKAAIAKAKHVTRVAKRAAAYVAKHSPVRAVLAAAKPMLSAAKKLVSAAAHLPAKVVQTTRNVVHDTVKSATAIYQKAVDVAGAVVENVSKAVEAVGDFAQAAAPYLKAALKVAADASGVTDLVSCVTKGDLEACAWTAATIGGYLLGGVGGGAVRAARVASLAARHSDDAVSAVRTGRRVTDNVAEAGECVREANSFAGDTLVRLAGGGTKRIDQVRPGDQVLATDPTTGRTEFQPVTDVIVGEGRKDLVEITTNTGEVVATQNHPIWAADLNKWVDAGDLVPGNELLSTSRGVTTVIDTHEWTEERRVYNLTVDVLHTYYVLAGNTDLLTHNVACPKHPHAGGTNDWAKCNGGGKHCGILDPIDMQRTGTVQNAGVKLADDFAQVGINVAGGSIDPGTALLLMAGTLPTVVMNVGKRAVRRLFGRKS